MANEILNQVIAGKDLSEDQMMTYLGEIMSGEKSDAEIASFFLTALKIKGEAVSEIVAGAKVLREKKAAPIDMGDLDTIDTCGTGGDSSGTYNISTAVAIVSAAAGVPVVKHGNRSVSSKCGCADVLEACGVKIDITPDQVKECVNEIGIGFLFAPTFHSAMRFVGPTRKALGFRTIFFNILGPLSNPANAKAQVVGVFDERLTVIFAQVLKELGLRKVLVVHGRDGLDEFSTTDETLVSELNDGVITTYTVKPEDFGIKRASMNDLLGGETGLNAEILQSVLGGEMGPKRDILLLNAGAALYVADKVTSIKEGMDLAAKVIDDGLATKKLEEFVAKTNNFPS